MTSPSTVCQSSEGDVKETLPLQEETPLQAKIMTSPSTVCQSSEGDVKETTVLFQEETPVQAKILHTISNISDGDSLTVSETPNCLMESKPLRDKTKENNKASLVTIPLEIRHQIYGLLLVSQDDLPARLPLRNDREGYDNLPFLEANVRSN